MPSPRVLAYSQLSSRPLSNHESASRNDTIGSIAAFESRTGVIGQVAVSFPLLVSLCVVDLGIFVITLITSFVDAASTNT